MNVSSVSVDLKNGRVGIVVGEMGIAMGLKVRKHLRF